MIPSNSCGAVASVLMCMLNLGLARKNSRSDATAVFSGAKIPPAPSRTPVSRTVMDDQDSGTFMSNSDGSRAWYSRIFPDAHSTRTNTLVTGSSSS